MTELNRLERIFRAALEVSPTGMAVLRDTTIEWHNRAMKEILKIKEEAIGQEITQFFSPLHKLESEDLLFQHRSGVVKWIRKDGSEFDCLQRCADLSFSVKEPLTLLVIEDITEHKQLERNLLKSNREWEQIFNMVPDPICLIDTEYKILRANRAMARLTGKDPSEILGLKCFELVHNSKQPPSYCPNSRLLEDRSEHSVTVRIESLDRYFDISVSPMLDPEGNLVGSVHVARDVTRLKQTEEKRLSVERKLHQAKKYKSLATMAQGIAHHFNNLLLAVVGNLDMALVKIPYNSPCVSFLKEAEKAANRATELSQIMLTYTGQRMGRSMPLDIVENVERFLQENRDSIPANVHLEAKFAPGLPKIQIDPDDLREILRNLVTNAQEAIGAKEGIIRISLETVKEPKPFAGINYTLVPLGEGPYICLEIFDSGEGIDQGEQDKLFDPFYSTKYTGRGLGLAITLGIVRSYRGAIFVESKPRYGTSIKVLFPVHTSGSTDELSSFGF